MNRYTVFQTALGVLALVMGVLVLIGTKAHSQEAPQGPPCAPSVAVDQTLEKQYGETITGAVVADSAGFVVLTTNPKTGTFTILMRRPDGMSCIIVGGKGWALADPAKVKGDGL